MTATFYTAKGGQGCTTVALAAAVLLGRGRPVEVTAHDPDEMAAIAGRAISFEDSEVVLAPGVQLITDTRRARASVVVHDAGPTLQTPSTFEPSVEHTRYLVTRPCFLALRAALAHPTRPAGVILVEEPGRGISAADIETILGAPVLARIPFSPQIARGVDAGLLPHRLPRALEQPLKPLVAGLDRGELLPALTIGRVGRSARRQQSLGIEL